jgi:GNAT superfamily N-acetyltransferase
VVGVLGYSIQCALRMAGAYCLIQEVWVTPALRSAGVARMLLDELARECAELGVRRVEVCLPHPAFPAFDRTQAFYERNGFRALGPRLIKDLT